MGKSLVYNSIFVDVLEAHIGRQELEGFVCEDTDDLILLLNELRHTRKPKSLITIGCH